ncbi:unnamed protein product [Nippostrongylus brasiliensis]|uniref:Uncharacterized protein n=1 Tax=Nippostrongylus brasiliensis TaxID=27835 RepID=A0A0N4XDV0_NIPBR|nr:unnamed protein product [Nippostrongylus brasiliensis]
MLLPTDTSSNVPEGMFVPENESAEYPSNDIANHQNGGGYYPAANGGENKRSETGCDGMEVDDGADGM